MKLSCIRQAASDLPIWSSEMVVVELEDAMATLRALPQGGYSPRLASLRLDIPADDLPCEPFNGRVRFPRPSAADITKMDASLKWLSLIPEDRRALRKIVGLRAVTHFESRKPLSWRKVAQAVGADPNAVKTWHAAAIEIIARRLNAERIAPRSSITGRMGDCP